MKTLSYTTLNPLRYSIWSVKLVLSVLEHENKVILSQSDRIDVLAAS